MKLLSFPEIPRKWLGIALGRLELVRTMLADGRLVVLSTPRRVAEHEYAHWLIQGDVEPREDVIDVIAWLRSQSAEMDAGS